MTSFTIIVIIGVIGLVGLLSYGLLLLPNKTKYRWLVILLFIFLSPMFVSQATLWQGTAKESRFELLENSESLVVLYFKLESSKAIYLLLEGSEGEIKWYKFPWSDKNAQELLEAYERANDRGEEVTIKNPFGLLLDEELEFDHEVPQEADLELKLNE